jgi:hypothetical protein
MHLEIENLKIQYGLKSKAALENINLGKSTLGRLLFYSVEIGLPRE